MKSRNFLFFTFVFLFSIFSSTNRLSEIKWVDEVKEGEYILCSNHPNTISWLEEGQRKSYWAYIYPYKNKNSAYANLRVSLEGNLGSSKLIGEDLTQGDHFSFNGKKWEIVSLGFSGIRAKKINGEHYFLGHEYCNGGFMYLKSELDLERN
jgi:hypothetical protein